MPNSPTPSRQVGVGRISIMKHCLVIRFSPLLPWVQRLIISLMLILDCNQDEKEGRYETFYGIMAAAQLEIRSHYFIRGEYQWALKSDYDGIDERRTNMFSVSLVYRF